MKPRSHLSSITTGFVAAILAVFTSTAIAAPAKKPLKVFILAGQSNMEGHAWVGTFDYMARDPVTAPILKEMRNADGTARVCEKVWISYSYGDTEGEPGGEMHGKLTTGFGANPPRNADYPLIGPEFTFGIYMQKMLDEPILFIKTGWGGRSLNTDFRPPSAGPYELNQYQLDLYTKQGKNIEKLKAEKAEASGRFYRLMIEHVKKVLADIKRVYPDYDPKQGYELAGFVWFQGWNDMCDSHAYPDRGKPGGYDLYSKLLAQFIRDVRKDLSAPDMPFVIGVIGVGGVLDKKTPNRDTVIGRSFRMAMAAPANLPEFKGNVVNVLTEKYWDDKLGELALRGEKVQDRSAALNKDASLSHEQRTAALDKYKAELFTPEELNLMEEGISNGDYHYLGAAKILAQIGKGFAEAMVELMKPQRPAVSVQETKRFASKCLELRIGDVQGFVILPLEAAADGSRPWVWYAPSYWKSYPNERLTWLFSRLLKRGFYVCGTSVGDSFGSPQSRKIYSRFYEHVVKEYGLSPKVCLLPQSRGGLMWYNWAVENPEKVACIGGIYPACDLTSYPGLGATAMAYGMTETDLTAQLAQHNPIERLVPLAKAKVPILHLHGDKDDVVPLEKNSGELIKRYQALDGPGELVVIAGQGHAEIPQYFESEKLLEFFLKHARQLRRPESNASSWMMKKDE